MIGEASLNESNRIRIDKYSLSSGELVWTRVLGAGRLAEFNISWTGGAYTLDQHNAQMVAQAIKQVNWYTYPVIKL
jgi:hypothetical protein